MVLHPACPCSRASLGEFEVLMGKFPGQVQGYAVLAAPHASADDDAYAAIHDLAARIPGVTPIRDSDGRIAEMFGASTSGHVAMFDASGTLRFSGGITLSRGHAGLNDGATTIEAILRGHKPLTMSTPVFGCAMKETP